MKIDLSQTFENGDGTPAIDAETQKPITLKAILLQILLNDQCPPDQKAKRFSLFRDVSKSTVGYVNWTAEDVALVKAAVLQSHGVLVVGQVHEMLERPYREDLCG